VCYGQGRQQVSGRHVSEAARDTVSVKRRIWPWAAGSTLALAASGAIAWVVST